METYKPYGKTNSYLQKLAVTQDQKPVTPIENWIRKQ